MQALILAGGFGTRLGNLAKHAPKPMLPVAGRPFLEHIVWNLRRHGITEIVGAQFKEGLVRADDIPLVIPVLGGAELPRGARVRVKLGDIDLITLDVKGTVVEHLDAPPEPMDLEDEGEEEAVAGPIAIAVDVNETDDSSAVTSDNPAQ